MRIILRFLLILIGLFPIAGQETVVAEKSFIEKLPLSIGDGPLEIHLSGIGPASKWVVGIVVVPGQSYFAVGNGGLVSTSRGRMLSGFHQHESAGIISERGKVSLNFGAQGSRAILVYIAIPGSLKVALFADKTLIADAEVTRSLFVKDGEVLNEPLNGYHDVFSRLSRPETAALSAMARTPTGEVFVSKDVFYQHLLGIDAIPAIPVPATTPHAWLVVEVSTNGSARAVSDRGDPQAAHLATSLVSSWKLTPFVFEGKTVPVRSTLLFGIDSSGKFGIVR